MYFLIGADFVPTEKNLENFSQGNALALLGKPLFDTLVNADYRIFNLEVPLTDTSNPIEKCGPNLIAPAKAISGYKACKINVFTLANNHILDQGARGLDDTCTLLKENKIDYLGAGRNLDEARRPYFFSFAERRVGIYACAEHEFTIATNSTPGANPFDPLESLDHVTQLKSQCDYVIVLYHGGKEHYQYPSPYLQKLCRKMVEKGADLVVCQHTHCIGCEEKWGKGTIVYGQGNFLFDDCEGPYKNESVLVRVNENFTVSYIPIQKGNGTVQLALNKDVEEILSKMKKRSQQIISEEFVENNYAAYSKTIRNRYLYWFSETYRKFWARVLNRISAGKFREWLAPKIFCQRVLLAMENYIECEAHRELLLHIIRELREMHGKETHSIEFDCADLTASDL